MVSMSMSMMMMMVVMTMMMRTKATTPRPTAATIKPVIVIVSPSASRWCMKGHLEQVKPPSARQLYILYTYSIPYNHIQSMYGTFTYIWLILMVNGYVICDLYMISLILVPEGAHQPLPI